MKKRFSEEQIVRVLGEAAGHGVPATARKYNVSEQTLYVWRRRYEGMDVSQVAELKRLQVENARLKKVVAEQHLALDIAQEALQKNRERAGPAEVGTARAAPGSVAGAGLPAYNSTLVSAINLANQIMGCH